ncbi:DUF134 domain-containing protein [Ferrimonas sediminicola]|uniref:UPF0251 protein FCL40_10695 n=1 Tax=Ferrimonas sediminicola TaxID=2569538 RepID=A0A4U1BDF9_9GAMM|nr:DUF134 domain-containing protein [Ferrimonas sediminicola]TKB48621.1 DUF134 domain-containing protein [Ferrimonas sediminicola]
MPRPKLTRKVRCRAPFSLYKPNGVPGKDLIKLPLGADELEAMRLTDMEGMSQQQAAQEMGVSRQTLGNIVTSARRKVVSALVRGQALEMESSLPFDPEQEEQ